MKKVKFLAVIGLMILFFASSYYEVRANEIVDSSGFLYEENNDNTVSITGYIGEHVTDKNYTLIIPSEINNKKVYSIKELVCHNKDIVVEDGIIELCNYAFANCFNLFEGSITLPNSITIIGEKGFVPFKIYANPNSYAKTYASTHAIHFSCIVHSSILNYIEEIAPTYEKNGQKAGYFCSICGTAIKGGEVIPMLKHQPEYPTTKKIETTTNPKKSKIVSVSNALYKVISSNTNNSIVEYSGTKKIKKSLTIPSTITVNRKKYKVTSIAKNAFKNNKTLKKITMGNNITKINANAFIGCKKLKTIIIKSNKLKFIGRNAFKGIHPKAKIKVPAKKIKKYKKLFRKKGLKSTVKIIKI